MYHRSVCNGSGSCWGCNVPGFAILPMRNPITPWMGIPGESLKTRLIESETRVGIRWSHVPRVSVWPGVFLWVLVGFERCVSVAFLHLVPPGCPFFRLLGRSRDKSGHPDLPRHADTVETRDIKHFAFMFPMVTQVYSNIFVLILFFCETEPQCIATYSPGTHPHTCALTVIFIWNVHLCLQQQYVPGLRSLSVILFLPTVVHFKIMMKSSVWKLWTLMVRVHLHTTAVMPTVMAYSLPSLLAKTAF